MGCADGLGWGLGGKGYEVLWDMYARSERERERAHGLDGYEDGMGWDVVGMLEVERNDGKRGRKEGERAYEVGRWCVCGCVLDR